MKNVKMCSECVNKMDPVFEEGIACKAFQVNDKPLVWTRENLCKGNRWVSAFEAEYEVEVMMRHHITVTARNSSHAMSEAERETSGEAVSVRKLDL